MTLNATRRLSDSSLTLPLARPSSAGDSGISVPMRPSAGPKRTIMRVRSSLRSDVQVEVGEDLRHLVGLVALADLVDDLRQRVGHLRARRERQQRLRGAPRRRPASSAVRAAAATPACSCVGASRRRRRDELDEERPEVEQRDQRARASAATQHRDAQRVRDVEEDLLDAPGGDHASAQSDASSLAKRSEPHDASREQPAPGRPRRRPDGTPGVPCAAFGLPAGAPLDERLL